MARYKVTMEKTVTYSTEVEVEAPDEDAAGERASDQADAEMSDGGETTPEWGRTDWSEVGDEAVETTAVELADG